MAKKKRSSSSAQNKSKKTKANAPSSSASKTANASASSSQRTAQGDPQQPYKNTENAPSKGEKKAKRSAEVEPKDASVEASQKSHASEAKKPASGDAESAARSVDVEASTSTEKPEPPGETWPQRLRRWGWQFGFLFALYLVISAWMTRSLLPTGQAAPPFELATLDGTKHSLRQYKGRRVILHFWATWCNACKMNMPIMRTMASGYRKDPVLLTVVTDGQERAAVKRIVKEKKLNYPILLAGPGLARQYRIDRYPTTYFIDRKGRIASKDAGVITPLGFWWRSIWLSLRGLR